MLQTKGGDVVRANYIGTDVTGTQALSNGGDGVDVQATGNNTIGGSGPKARNVISGNAVDGILLFSPAGTSEQNNVVAANYIGTDATGKVTLGNGSKDLRQNKLSVWQCYFRGWIS